MKDEYYKLTKKENHAKVQKTKNGTVRNEGLILMHYTSTGTFLIFRTRNTGDLLNTSLMVWSTVSPHIHTSRAHRSYIHPQCHCVALPL